MSGDFDNPNPGPIHVGTVTVSVTGTTIATPLCDATNYTIVSPVTTVNLDLPAGSGVGAWSGPTIAFNNKVTNQDFCKNAVVNLAYTSN